MIQTFLSRVIMYGCIVDVDVSASAQTITMVLQRGGQAQLVLILRDVRAFGAMMLQVDTTRPLTPISPRSPSESLYPDDVLFDLFWADIDAHIVEFPQSSSAFVHTQMHDPRWISWWPQNHGTFENDKLVHMAVHDMDFEGQSCNLEVMICTGAVELYIEDALYSAEKLYKQHLSHATVPLPHDVGEPPQRDIKLSASEWAGVPDGLLHLFKTGKAWVAFDETSLVQYHLHAIHDWFIDADRAYFSVRAEQFYCASEAVSLVDVQMTFWHLEQWVVYEIYHVTV